MRFNGYGDIVYPGSRDFATADEWTSPFAERLADEQKTAERDEAEANETTTTTDS